MPRVGRVVLPNYPHEEKGTGDKGTGDGFICLRKGRIYFSAIFAMETDLKI